jgi:hypothetical protein
MIRVTVPASLKERSEKQIVWKAARVREMTLGAKSEWPKLS